MAIKAKLFGILIFSIIGTIAALNPNEAKINDHNYQNIIANDHGKWPLQFEYQYYRYNSIHTVKTGDLLGDSKKEILITVPNQGKTDMMIFDHNGNKISHFSVPSEDDISIALGQMFGNSKENIIHFTKDKLSIFNGSGNLLKSNMYFYSRYRYKHLINQLPVVIDLNGDKLKEIIVATHNPYKFDEVLLILNENLNIISQIQFKNQISIREGYFQFAVGNFDKDSALEVLVLHIQFLKNAKNEIYWRHNMHIFNYDGTPLEKWKVIELNGAYMDLLNIIIADLDKDGFDDIIYKNRFINVINGRTFSRTKIPNSGAFSIGDVNSDGYDEIVFSNGPKVYDRMGNLLYNNNYFTYYSSSIPILSDIDGDKNPDIIFVSNNSIQGVNFFGKTIFSHYFKEDFDVYTGTMFIDDIDNDKKSELIGSYRHYLESNQYLSKVFILDLNVQYDERFTPWPSYHHDFSNTLRLTPYYIHPPANVIRIKRDYLTPHEDKCIYEITWSKNPKNNNKTIKEYRIYRRNLLNSEIKFELIDSVPSDAFFYFDRFFDKTSDLDYAVTAVTTDDKESTFSATIKKYNN
jgi:hypothetical protein